MCTVSMIGDTFRDEWPRRYPNTFPPTAPRTWPAAEISRLEFDLLKREVEMLKELLKAAKRYDEENGEPDCEIDEKVALIKRVAEMVGVDLADVFEADK